MGAARRARRLHRADPLAERCCSRCCRRAKRWHAARARPRAATRARLRATPRRPAPLFTACAVVAFLPQMLAWKAIYGSYLARSRPSARRSAGGIRTWSTSSGRRATDCSAWSPVLYVGAIGLVAVRLRAAGGRRADARGGRRDGLLQRLIQDWWGSAGFGGRRFDGTIPLFALGLAAFVERDGGWSCGVTRCAPSARFGALLVAVEPGADERGAGAGTSASARRCRSATPARTRRARSTAGSAIRSPIRPACSSRAQRRADRRLRSARRQSLPRRSAAALRTHRRRPRRRTRGCADGWHGAGDGRRRSPSGGRIARARCSSRSTTRRPARPGAAQAFDYPGRAAADADAGRQRRRAAPSPSRPNGRRSCSTSRPSAWRAGVNRRRHWSSAATHGPRTSASVATRVRWPRRSITSASEVHRRYRLQRVQNRYSTRRSESTLHFGAAPQACAIHSSHAPQRCRSAINATPRAGSRSVVAANGTAALAVRA